MLGCLATTSNDNSQCQTNGDTRMELNSNVAVFPGNVSITGNMTGGGVQPLLTSVVGHGAAFHSVLGTATAANQLKASNWTSGINA